MRNRRFPRRPAQIKWPLTSAPPSAPRCSLKRQFGFELCSGCPGRRFLLPRAPIEMQVIQIRLLVSPVVRMEAGSPTGVAIDQYAEAALGNREFFLNKPYGIGGRAKDNILTISRPVHMIKLTQEREMTPYVGLHPDDDDRR